MDWWTCNRKYDCIHSVALSKPKVSSGGISKIIYLLHSDSYCSVTSMWGWTLFMCACDLKNVISTPPPFHTYTHAYFFFIRWSNYFSLQNIKLQCLLIWLIKQIQLEIWKVGTFTLKKVYPSRGETLLKNYQQNEMVVPSSEMNITSWIKIIALPLKRYWFIF